MSKNLSHVKKERKQKDLHNYARLFYFTSKNDMPSREKVKGKQKD